MVQLMFLSDEPLTEKEYAEHCGICQSSTHKRKTRVLAKSKNLLETSGFGPDCFSCFFTTKLTLKSYDDIFKTDEQRAEDAKEKVMELPLGELFPFPEHPFRVLNDEAMRDTAESVKQ